MRLSWASYKHFPYERELALREAEVLIDSDIRSEPDGVMRASKVDLVAGRSLTYFSSVCDGSEEVSTQQSLLEASALTGRRRQSTRYSVHGLHEYKGKFNPQVCRALINILGLKSGDLVLDPFCGSGTTLVEAAHLGVEGRGYDLNPLAVLIANAKLSALTTPAAHLGKSLVRILRNTEPSSFGDRDDERLTYLRSWFEDDVLLQIENLHNAIVSESSAIAEFFLVIASNLLRDFSLQDPSDLRIRRRLTANACEPFQEAFCRAAESAIERLALAQRVVGSDLRVGRALICDSRVAPSDGSNRPARAAITSPPYASALPYIDTQRLSLIWLGLLTPEELRTTEADLIGSRELTTAERRLALNHLQSNDAQLPAPVVAFCRQLQTLLGKNDGFRRQAVPILFYRYCVDMRRMFASILTQVEPQAPFALIVGHNHTTLGGQRIEIETPQHLCFLAESVGWTVEECLPLQAYQRFSLHSSNAVTRETLIILRSPLTTPEIQPAASSRLHG